MLSLFKVSPLLSDEETQWLIDTFVWAFEHFDGEYFLNETQIITPTPSCFPEPVSSIEEMAAVVFSRVKSYAGLQQWPITLVAPERMLASTSMTKLNIAGRWRGEQAVIAEPAAPILISYNPNQINQPQDLIASYAGVMAKVLILQRGVLPPGGEAQLDAACDVLASFFGFGVMVSNTVYHFRGGCGSCYNQYANRKAALTEQQSVFVHALVCHFKGVKDGHKHLKSHLVSQYKKAKKQINTLMDNSERGDLLALQEHAHARLS
ncbi:hypothetical protein CWB89_08985 [Pseudoalteromonas piscicida]|uniref:Uncharacterized protein n=1 Tax=Pseudoalteromonas piscicida TaxID=43662 RepID=A0AAQ2ESZ0_PSEO7|nr:MULTISPECIES: hypothetical protein [Pseudoalteromonas]KJY91074.1 hypothetical protein TW75_05610 [Pseudoalteromonas piscicida]TMN34356.1 hypothetical protein CWB95_20820 [Pseudoalteromonas piscicida]TMN36651.1 hypothetical protein CWB94_18295 [Pseudoalteromonas piscicida]TMN47716.1 hypothetical protein CWB92_19250 [Pseudoalteromonas piscicida]TMN48029.1 hypothetical protein CWB91_19870 [Pseudoalteromonas piscicida]